MIDIREYGQMARETGAYKDIELDILEEALRTWQARPGDPYTILELRDGKTLAGFAVLSKAVGTDFTFDVRDFCIERAYIGKGVSLRLIEMLEDEVLRMELSAIVRFETSRRKEDAAGRGTFLQAGYTLIGHIADFYDAGDDYFIYAKHIRREKVEVSAATESPPAGEADKGDSA